MRLVRWIGPPADERRQMDASATTTADATAAPAQRRLFIPIASPHALMITGMARSGLATMASWPASMRSACAVGIASNSFIWRRSGTTWSCIVTTTAVGTSTSPSQSSERNDPIALPASSTIRQSWRTTCSTAHGDHVLVLRCRYS